MWARTGPSLGGGAVCPSLRVLGKATKRFGAASPSPSIILNITSVNKTKNEIFHRAVAPSLKINSLNLALRLKSISLCCSVTPSMLNLIAGISKCRPAPAELTHQHTLATHLTARGEAAKIPQLMFDCPSLKKMEIYHRLDHRKPITSIVPSTDIGIWWTTIHQDPASISHRPNTVFGMRQAQKARDCGR